MADSILDLQQGASVGDQAGGLSRLKESSWGPQSAWSKKDVNGNVRSRRFLGYSSTFSEPRTEAPCAAHSLTHTIAHFKFWDSFYPSFPYSFIVY